MSHKIFWMRLSHYQLNIYRFVTPHDQPLMNGSHHGNVIFLLKISQLLNIPISIHNCQLCCMSGVPYVMIDGHPEFLLRIQASARHCSPHVTYVIIQFCNVSLDSSVISVLVSSHHGVSWLPHISCAPNFFNDFFSSSNNSCITPKHHTNHQICIRTGPCRYPWWISAHTINSGHFHRVT